MKGRVSLVGAGPGDPGLITVAGLERLREADVVVHDRLVSPRLLEHVRTGAEIIYMGKVAGEAPHDQEAINRLLVEKAREGKRVVRLKGGDPFVFGRGSEEAESLRAAGVEFEVVPGVTSAVAVPAYAGIPVTHRGVASSFAVVTGHEDAGKGVGQIDWAALAGVDTLVLLMGVKTLPEIVERLLGHGRAPETPAAVIRWGTTPDQRTVTGTLGDIARKVERAGITPPAITIVGEVVRLRDTISWFEDRPLFGKRVLVTRARRQASALVRLLWEEGAVPIELPAIEIERSQDRGALERAVEGLAAGVYAWIGFTSANGVDLFFQALRERGLDARAFGATRVFAIGPATARALESSGIVADLVPGQYVAEAVVEAMRPRLAAGDRVLLPRAESVRPALVEGLRRLGAEVEEAPVYRTALPKEPSPEALADLRGGLIDIVTFTSSSTVRNLAAMLDGDLASLRRTLVVCIGPITAEAASDLGLRVDVVAEEYTVEGLVRALKEYVKSHA